MNHYKVILTYFDNTEEFYDVQGYSFAASGTSLSLKMRAEIRTIMLQWVRSVRVLEIDKIEAEVGSLRCERTQLE